MTFLENLLSDYLPFSMLITVGTYLSLKYRFPQISSFGRSVKLTARAFKKRGNSESLTSFKAACTALSATVGTGNIAGVAGAISIGGAGAVFWMWISAFLGMIIKSAEITLAVIYREKDGSSFKGGPMYYIKNGLPYHFKILATVFCLAAIPTVFFSGNLTQTNSAVTSFCNDGISKSICGIFFALLCGICIRGSFKRIGTITEKIVPFMSMLYILLSIIILFKNHTRISTAFGMILEGAFNPKAVTGGAVGSLFTSMFVGASRGVFSNESGLGTSAMAHSVAVDADSNTQGLYGIFEVFVDTILLCTLTALTILTSSVKINYGEIASTELVGTVFTDTFGGFGNVALSVMMCLFAFSSVIGWAVYGKICCSYIFGKTGDKIFTLIYPAFCFLGVISESAFVWRMAALGNGIMLCTNLTALLLLRNKVTKYLKGNEKDDTRKIIQFKKNPEEKHRRLNFFRH